MMRRIGSGLVILTTVVTVGCETVAYHHSERVSIALEVKSTEPQQPVQGNIGIKTRTVLVTPEKTQGGESVSVVSDFKLHRDESGLFGKTRIQSMFLTGDAAKEAPPATLAVVGGLASSTVGSGSATARKQVLDKVYDALKLLESEGDSTAKKHVEQLDKLAALLPTPAPTPFYNYSSNVLSEVTTDPTAGLTGFKRALRYLDTIDGSIAAIQAAEDNRTTEINGALIDKMKLGDLRKEKTRFETLRKSFLTMIADSPLIDAAATYIISRI